MPLTRWAVDASKIHSVITHRCDPHSEDAISTQFLLRWKCSTDEFFPPLSWHGVHELGSVLDLLQQYVTALKEKIATTTAFGTSSIAGRKRRLSGTAIDNQQLLTPVSSASPKASSFDIFNSTSKQDATVFNSYLRRRAGLIYAVKSDTAPMSLDLTDLPSFLAEDAARCQKLVDVETAIRLRYIAKLRKLPGPPVYFSNDFDRATPNVAFEFISTYRIGKGIIRHDEIMVGCQKCRPNMGANRGCEYTKKCDCLEFAAPDLDKLDSEQRAEYDECISQGLPPPEGLGKRFPYINTGPRAGCLVDFYLDTRHAIYECNESCRCGPKCKNRNVQHGRKVELEIFRTSDGRGFGLRCRENLRRGQFIDTYRGEIITDAEADVREERSGHDKASYLFSMDKFKGDMVDGGNIIADEDCYVVDGQFMGGPTRFINHSCSPNLQMHTVSYNKHDLYIYDLAFFANRDIPAGEELAFDYMDQDDLLEGPANDGQDAARAGGLAATDENGRKRIPCRCQAPNCRKFMWGWV